MDWGVQEAHEAFQDMAGEVMFHQSLSGMSCSSCGCRGDARVGGRSGSVWVQPGEELAVETNPAVSRRPRFPVRCYLTYPGFIL